MTVDLRVISLGAGVQSTTMYCMAALGEIGPKPDYAIFADTMQEPYWVYRNLERLEARFGDVLPIVRCSAGDLGEAVAKGANLTGGRFASVPFWVESQGKEAPGNRQCTREHKITPIHQTIRRLAGLKPRQRAIGKVRAEEWIGISTDEAHRAKPSRYEWISTRWPLLEERMNRHACKEWLKRNGIEVPQKSACVFCPYRKAIEYAHWRDEEPELFEEACRWDELIRSKGTMRGMRGQQYIWRKLRPLRELPTVSELSRTDDAQIDLFGNECEGICGV